jgi:hypothetical protein
MKEGFYVVGGEYTDTSFTTLVMGTEEKHGPFLTREDAVRKWRERTGWTIDNCLMKFSIVSPANDVMEFVKRLKAACK